MQTSLGSAVPSTASVASAVTVACVLVVAACSSDDNSSDAPGNSGPSTTSAGTTTTGGAAVTTSSASTTGGTPTSGSTTSASTTAGPGTTTVTSTGTGTGTVTGTGTTGGTGTTTTGTEGSGTGGSSTTGTGSSTTGTTVPNGEAFTVDYELASDVEASAPGTIGIVTWSIADVDVESATIEFGLDTSYGMTAPVDLTAADFRTLLLGMKPASSYHFRVSAVSGGTSYTSDDYVIETGPPTSDVSMGEFTIQQPEAYERGFMILSYWQGTGSSMVFVLDADGDIVWWYDSGSNGIARARMSADGKNMWMISPNNNGGPLQRVSMDTLDAQTYSNAVGSHDMTPVSGATMAYLEYGESDCDSIFEIDPSGTTTEVFESDDFLGGGGMCHANALRYSKTEDVFTLTDVSQDVLVVSRAGEVEWRLSELLPGGMATHGGRQHGQQLLDESMLVFANAGGGQNISAAVEYNLEGEEIWRYEAGLYTANLGDVQRLPGGNTLITFANDSVVHQVDQEKNVVLEFDGNGANIGYVLWTPSLYEPTPDQDL